MTAKEIGDFGESVAAEFLEKKNIKVLKRNYHCRAGEIDIIAKDGDCTVFCEVKTRHSSDFGTPAEFVDFRKQEKIMKTALYYTMRDDIEMRFDVVEVFYTKKGDVMVVTKVNHIENAF